MNNTTYKFSLFLGLLLSFYYSDAYVEFVKIGDPIPINYFAYEKDLRKNFFEDIMGIDESAWLNSDKASYITVDNSVSKKFKLKNSKTHQEYQAGYFQEFSIEQLRAEAAKLPKVLSGTFNVRAGYNTTAKSWFRCFLDIGAMQADSAHKNAVFQVASNFSALEPVSKNDYPEGGITKYIYDYTQGPFASLSAAPGVIYRMYYIFYDSNSEAKQWRQTSSHQINFLDKLSLVFPVINGYVDLHKALDRELTQEAISKIKIGFHDTIQVTYGFTQDDSHCKITDQGQYINQVFTAAIDFGNLNGDLRDHPEAIRRAQLILDAAYEGTIKAAAIKGKKKLFLTLIGGGVFNNDLSWIANAIEKNKQFIQESGLEVTLVIYSYDHFSEFHQRMLTLTQETKGNFIIYKADGIYTCKLNTRKAKR